ncbi:carboxypeptidase-like regulatory domain-containing protein [Ochrovirga pacifica]|uniref:carboxypeptidase-like regulatory domain-containing protein n=1 Tax=Ochrovirga pacifica TaxID=1042376 RepID=UPI0002557FDC|nr:carboxypeptidase-like regulatory domain-containing protein [Ochrovirga pacifica]
MLTQTKNRSLWLLFWGIFITSTIIAQDKKIILKGTIYDEVNETVPFVTVGIVNKTIGTASTEDGEFALMITPTELTDTLYVSSLGFDTFRMKVQDYLDSKERKIVLKESVVSLDAVVLLKPKDYMENALKSLKNNTLSKKPHVKEILYRRFASEDGKAKFFVENYIKYKDRGPAYWMGRFQVKEARKSVDYRFWKHTQWKHSIEYMSEVNPIRPGDSFHKRNLKKFEWKKTGSSSYEGEDVVILEGTNPEKSWEKMTFYVGIDNYKIYRIERGDALYIYKKHKDGKMYLSYYCNQWGFPKDKMPSNIIGTVGETLHYKAEAFVLNVITDKKKTKIKDYGLGLDMGSLDLPYHPEFWQKLNMPPDTKFYKKHKEELEGLFGVPLEKQYQLMNK